MQQSLSEEREQEPAGARTKSIARGIIAIALIAAIEVVLGWYRFFSWFQFPYFDDEGYMIVTVQEWMHNGGLYDEVFSQYGPFFPVAIGLPLRLAHIEPTIDNARWITVGLVVATSVTLAIAVLTLSRNLVASLIAQIGSFALLGQIESAALHPGALTTLLLAALVLNMARRGPQNYRRSDAITGMLLAAVLLTKINVGIFAVIAVTYVVTAGWPDERQRRWLRLVPEAALVLVGPVLLIQHIPQLDEVRTFGQSADIWNWVIAYVAAAVLTIVISRLTMRRGMRVEEPLSIARLAGGCAAATVAIVAVVMLRGTSPGALINGVLIRPTDFAGAVTALLPVPLATVAWFVAVPLLVLLVTRMARWSPSPHRLLISAAFRWVAAAALLFTAMVPDLATTFTDVHFGWFIVMLPLVVMLLVPRLGHDTLASSTARLFIVALSVT